MADAPRTRRIPARIRARLLAFLRTESSGAVLLLVAAISAMLWANSPWSDAYADLWKTERTVTIAGRALTADLKHVIADGLMALFFLVVGLEIKRELLEGDLRDRRTAVLPLVGAVGGMAVPALVYLAFNLGGAGARGWAIPTATDIAFAVGVLALAARHAPPALATFLLALAIVDDILAITIIALFYSSGVSLTALGAAAAIALAIAAAARVRHRLGRAWWAVHLGLGVCLWVAVARAGVHPTIAGVALGLLTPVTPDDDDVPSPLEQLESALHPWTSYVIVPVFGFSAAGVGLAGVDLAGALLHPVTVGVFLGLVVGKIAGITAATALAVRSRVARLPEGVGSRGTFAVSSVAGIGFTVALFVTDLAFGDGVLADRARIGILAGSALAGVLGWTLLRRVPPYTPGVPGGAGHVTAPDP